MADALSTRFRVHLWVMPGYGQSSTQAEHRVSLDVRGELLADLISHWRLERPHLVVHHYGGAVALRAHLLHGAHFRSLVLTPGRLPASTSAWATQPRKVSG